MSKMLLIGDLHTEKKNLAETAKLMDWIATTAISKEVQYITFFGDLYHGHSNVDTNVLDFYIDQFKSYRKKFERVILLGGNHDFSYDCTSNALLAHADQCEVILEPSIRIFTTTGGSHEFTIAYIPFMRDNDEFIKVMQKFYDKGHRMFFVHQEFDGSQYSNGFYSPSGVKIPPSMSDAKIVAGHIHMNQVIGNVSYIGTPRQLTISDYGQIKGICCIDLSNGGAEFIQTPEEVCETYKHFIVTSDNIAGVDLTKLNPSPKLIIDLKGTREFVESNRNKINPEIRVRPNIIAETVNTSVKESDGLPIAFMKYSQEFFNKNNIEDIDSDKIRQIIFNKCPILRGN